MRARLAASIIATACSACAGVQETPTNAPAPPVTVAPPVVAKPPPVVIAPPAPPRPERAAPVEVRNAEVDSLFAEFERLRRLPAAEIPREQEAARLAFNQSRTDSSRIRFAMASSLPGSGPVEEQRALDLLDPLVRTPGATLHGFAFLLSAFIQEQRRLASLVQGLQQNLQGLQQNNQALQQNVHGLQQKLDALRTLERSLSERGEPARRR